MELSVMRSTAIFVILLIGIAQSADVSMGILVRI